MTKVSFLLFLIFPVALTASFETISKSATHVEFRMTTEWSEVNQTLDGEQFSMWSADILTDNLPSNGRLLPVAAFRVMIPAKATPQIEVLNRETIQRQSNPFPPSGTMSEPRNSSTSFIEFNSHQSFRGYSLGQFTVYPASYKSGTVELTTSATIRVSWPASRSADTVSQFD